MNKKIFYSVALAAAALSMTGCADGELQDFFVSKTDSIANLEYLNQYDALKTYVNRQANPNFKLGVGEGAQNYVDQDITYRLANANFDEMTAGNAMKYASCVKEDGSMDFNLVKNFVSAASDAGMTVFGHTLAWHSQQQNKYLNGLIADKELPPDPNGGNKFLEITLGEAGANPWDKQIAYKLAKPLEKGADYVMSVKVKASQESGATFAAWPIWEASTNKNQWGGSNDVQYMATYDVSTEYTTLTWEFNAQFPIDKLQFVFGKVGGTLTCDDFKLVKAGSDDNLISNGDFSKESTTGWGTTSCNIAVNSSAQVIEIETEVRTKTYTDGPFPFYAMGCEPPVVNGAIHFVPKSPVEWSQFFILPGGENTLEEGNYAMYIDLTSDKNASGVQVTAQNGWGADAQSISAPVDVKAGQHNVRIPLNGIKGGNYDIVLKPQTADATLDVKSVKICKVTKSNSLPLTPEQKKDTLTWAMNKWIDGMMEACDGKVVAWDVVNEALSGADTDGDGIYDLQHAATASADDKKNCFYWQDYLGDLDYVRTAVKAARESFAAHNGNAADLKLFINDYNLEATWDNNKKLQSLIKWIERWEADQVTKIDGIASQMHVSYNADPAKQEKQKECIVNMYKLMAKSGKLCKVSELDMGYVDAAGNVVETKNLNDTQQKEMADFYQFIIEEYFKNIPANQRYGITQWCITDAPDNSGWRKSQPVGLWTQGYDRKRAYGGFAEGLKTGSPLQ